MLKHLLIQYRGGGYDGCFWEWNFCMFDDDGCFQDIHSSGRAGCDSEEKIKAFMQKNRKDKDFYLYNLKSEKQLAEFAAETNAGLVVAVAKWLYEYTPYQLYAVCSICGESVPAEDTEAENFSGCGGIAIQANDIICLECYSNHTCSYCGEFYGEEQDCLGEENFPSECSDGYCLYCHENQCDNNSYCAKEARHQAKEALVPVGQMDLELWKGM